MLPFVNRWGNFFIINRKDVFGIPEEIAKEAEKLLPKIKEQFIKTVNDNLQLIKISLNTATKIVDFSVASKKAGQ